MGIISIKKVKEAIFYWFKYDKAVWFKSYQGRENFLFLPKPSQNTIMYKLNRHQVIALLTATVAGAIFSSSLLAAETKPAATGHHLAQSDAADSNVRRPFVNPYYEQRQGFWKPEIYRGDSESARRDARESRSSRSKEAERASKHGSKHSASHRDRDTYKATHSSGADSKRSSSSGSSSSYSSGSGSVSDYINRYPVRLEKSVPSTVALNAPYNYDYRVTAREKVERVVVEEQIPPGTVYVSSDPEAEVSGDKVKWTLYNLEEGQNVPLRLTVKPTRAGDLSSCATIQAYQQACTTTTVGEPKLIIEKDTPEEQVLVGSNVPWNIKVTNTGNFSAHDVVVTDTIPRGLSHDSGQSSITSQVGTLAPGESRNITLQTTATETGRHCNLASVSASNANSADAKDCVEVAQVGLKIEKDGTEKQFVGKKASYDIVATNTGDLPLEDVVVTDTVPPQNRLLSAPGASIEGNTATWTVDLPAGQSKRFKVNVRGLEGGTYCNRVSARDVNYNLSGNSEACTEWTGHPALLIEVIDTVDPLLIGDKTTYEIQITNQGTARDTNVGLNVNVPAELKIVSASGSTNGTISGNAISFAPYPVLQAKEVINFRVVTEAVTTGDSRFRVKMNSDLLKTPVPEEESTQVY